MFRRCLYCDQPFPSGSQLGEARHGRRIAYDPDRLRLWAICDACHRWNLVPLEDRGHVLERLERLARDHGRPLVRTDNVTLLEAGTLDLVRIGRAGIEEQAWWRYGQELRSRRRAYERPVSRLAGVAFGAMALITDGLSLRDLSLGIGWGDSPLADVLRYRRFGWSAWRGRETCPFCGSILRALRYDLSWWTYVLPRTDGRLELGIPCPRCDPWTPEKLFRLGGPQAGIVLRRILAYQHIAGADEDTIRVAARAITDAGSAEAYSRAVGEERVTLWRLGRERSVALEIAVNENAERHAMQAEVRGLEAVWKREEALARIVDDELSPSPPNPPTLL